MAQYIDKAALVAEIKKRIQESLDAGGATRGVYLSERMKEDSYILSIIDTLEVKEVNTWHLQEKEDIYDAVKDWGLYKFACIMKDGTIQRFNGCLDEDCEGHIHVHIDGVNDDYDDVDDIVKWIEC